MRQTAAIFALICALAGLTVSAMAANVHYHMLHDPTYTSFCDVSETVSCTQVSTASHQNSRRNHRSPDGNRGDDSSLSNSCHRFSGLAAVPPRDSMKRRTRSFP